MSPSSTSNLSPLLTAADNFDVWKARIRASLDGKNLLGSIDGADYDGVPKDEMADSDEDMDSMNEGEGDEEDPATDDLEGLRGISLDDLGNDANDEAKTEDLAIPPVPVLSFADTAVRTKKLKAKADTKARAIARAIAKAKAKPTAAQLRRMDAKVKSFLMKTLDDKHIRIVQAFDRSYDIYQTICNRYKGTQAYGDPYGIMNYLFNTRYREGDDLTEFILKYEDAMSGFNTVLNISMDEALASVFLFNAMPESWNNEMRIWRGNRDIIPYVELKSSLESHVTKKLAHERYALAKGTPESYETSKEKALVAATATEQATALAASAMSGDLCGYCSRGNHKMDDCRTLGNDLRNGKVKPNTTLPANYKLPPAFSPADIFSGRNHVRQTPYSRPSGRGNGQRHGYNNQRGYHGGRGGRGGNQGGSGYQQVRRETAMIAISMPATPTTPSPRLSPTSTYGLTATVTNETDPIWTIDSGCTRHVAYDDVWFTSKTPYVGSITVGGKNQIPILATGNVSLPVMDSKGNPKVLELRNVLYTPELKFNLVSVPAAVKDDFRFNFSRKQCAITTNQHFSIKAHIADNADLYQFKVSPLTAKTSTALIAHGTA